jgi:hypothetical protein
MVFMKLKEETRKSNNNPRIIKCTRMLGWIGFLFLILLDFIEKSCTIKILKKKTETRMSKCAFSCSVHCFKIRTEPAGQIANRTGDWSVLNVGSIMQLDWWEPFKTGEPAVSPNRRFDCMHFFSVKSPKNDVVLYFFFKYNKQKK